MNYHKDCLIPRRKLYKAELNTSKKKGYKYDGAELRKEVERVEDADLISSLTNKGTYMPVLDLDFPCDLVESSTPGHYHLYINKELNKLKFMILMHALLEVGLIEEGVFQQLKIYDSTFVRPPGVKK